MAVLRNWEHEWVGGGLKKGKVLQDRAGDLRKVKPSQGPTTDMDSQVTPGLHSGAVIFP